MFLGEGRGGRKFEFRKILVFLGTRGEREEHVRMLVVSIERI